MFQTRDQAPLRGIGTPEKPFGFHDATIDGGWQVPGEPYTNALRRIRLAIRLVARAHARRAHEPLGAFLAFATGLTTSSQTLATGSASTGRSTYEDLAPYYDKVEMLIGVYGANDGLENTPNSPPGCLLPPPKPRVSDLLRSTTAQDSSAIPVVAGHRAVLTQQLDSQEAHRAKLHPGNAKAQEILADRHEKRGRLFLGDALRPRLLDQGQLPIDDRAPAAGARDRQPRHHRRMRWCAR